MNNKFRLDFILIINGLLIITVFFSLIYFQVKKNKEYVELSKENKVKKITYSAPRGIIYDNEKNILAENIKSYSIYIIPTLFDRTYENILSLSEMINIDKDSLINKLRHTDEQFICIKNNIDMKTAIIIKEHSNQFKGVFVQNRFFRTYPFGKMFAHVIGYVGQIDSISYEIKKQLGYSKNDFVGKMGIERYYEKYLKGANGVSYYEIDAEGRIIKELEKHASTKTKQGYSLYTSLNITLQSFIDSITNEFNAISICVLNSETGQVLSLISKPSFNPNLFIYGIKSEIYNFLKRNIYAPFENKLIQKLYIPGNIFYPFISLIKLDDVEYDSIHSFQPCNGVILLEDKELYCWKNHGKLNLKQAFLKSCDIYFYQLGIEIGFKKISKKIKDNKLTEKTLIDLSEEEKGFLSEREFFQNNNNSILLESALIGAGKGSFNLTPIEMLVFINAFNNNGNMLIPTIVDSIESDNGIVYRQKIAIRNKLKFPQLSINRIRSFLYECVNEEGNNASGACSEYIKIYGITSLMQDNFNRENVYFVGFTSEQENNIAIIVLIENIDNGRYYTSSLAKNIIEFIYRNKDEIF